MSPHNNNNYIKEVHEYSRYPFSVLIEVVFS